MWAYFSRVRFHAETHKAALIGDWRVNRVRYTLVQSDSLTKTHVVKTNGHYLRTVHNRLEWAVRVSGDPTIHYKKVMIIDGKRPRQRWMNIVKLDIEKCALRSRLKVE